MIVDCDEAFGSLRIRRTERGYVHGHSALSCASSRPPGPRTRDPRQRIDDTDGMSGEHVSRVTDRLARRRARRAARVPRVQPDCVPAPKYISSGVWPGSAVRGSVVVLVGARQAVR